MISSRDRVRPSEGDVLGNGAAKQSRVLKNVADLLTQCLKLEVAYIVPSMMTFLGGIVETRNQADDGGFTAASRADDSYKLSRLNGEANV